MSKIIAAPMTEQQKRWAASHDWFVGVTPEGRVVCKDEYSKDGVFYREAVSFSDFSEMRRWAGY